MQLVEEHFSACSTHVRTVTWDSRFADVSTVLRSSIPRLVEERCRSARHRTSCGLAEQVAWASVDETLFVWDYRGEDPEVLVVPADSTIICVGFCPPRHGLFDVHMLLVVCTRMTVSLVGLANSRGHGQPASLDTGVQRPSPSGMLRAWGGDQRSAGVPIRRLLLMPLEGYATRTDGAVLHAVRHTSDGRIFLCGTHLYELAYARQQRSWLQGNSRCRLVQHAGWQARLRDFIVPSASRIRLMECAPRDFIFTVDEVNTIRLLRVRDTHEEGVSEVKELASLTLDALGKQAGERARVITHLFPDLGPAGPCLCLATSIGERLFFVCSAGEKFGFWLQGSGDAVGSLMEESPCIYDDGVWISGGVDVSFFARVEAEGGMELHQTLKLDSPVLDIVEESELSQPGQARWFAVLVTNAIHVLRLSFKTPQWPPTNALECCAHLMIASNPSLAAWSLDDARLPTFEEQHRCLEEGRAQPQMHLGMWCEGFLRFLSIVMRQVWGAVLVERRRGLSAVLGEKCVQRVLAKLRPVVRSMQGTPAGRTPCEVAKRSAVYVRRPLDGEAQAHARHVLHTVVTMTERAQEVLSLVSILHVHKNAYRVLQTVTETALDALLTEPLRTLVSTPQSMAPVIQLCTALIVESGLTTPAAELAFEAQGRSIPPSATPIRRVLGGDICKELEVQCPGIFAQVDLEFVRGQISRKEPSSGEFIHRYMRCVSSNSLEDHWNSLARSIAKMAQTDPRGAADIVIEKLQHVCEVGPADEATMRHVTLLLQGLVGSIQPEPMFRPVFEHLFVKTAAIVVPGHAGRPAAHRIVLEHLLSSSRHHPIFDWLLDTSTTDIVSFLEESSSPVAGEFLWKYYWRHNQPGRASGILLSIAEKPSTCSLDERIRYLDLSREAAGRSSKKELVEKLTLQLDLAMRVQTPLCLELQLVASDSRLSTRWHETAESCLKEFSQLQDLHTLFQTAVHFGLFHIILVAAHLSPAHKELASSIWVGVFFPPLCPYSSTEMVSKPAVERGLFPLLLVRRCASFLTSDSEISQEVRIEDFQCRTTKLVEELEAALPSSMWDPRCVVTLLEYGNCVWLHTFETVDTEQDRAWVALHILPRRPYRYTFLTIVKLYADMIAGLGVWAADLKSSIPDTHPISEDELCNHIGTVLLFIIDRWMRTELIDADPSAWSEVARVLDHLKLLRFDGATRLLDVGGQLAQSRSQCPTVTRPVVEATVDTCH